MSTEYTVVLSGVAQEAYTRIFEEAQPALRSGNTSNAKVKLLRIVDECLDKLIPHDPLQRSRTLAGGLSSIYRVKKGRLRICYVVSHSERQIIVLYISESVRKDGDKHDPYKVFTHLVMSGEFDSLFEKIGLKKPERRVAHAPFRIQ